MIHYVYADSRNRAEGTFGNSYTLYLTTPVKNVTRVDLVAAKIPNCLYNISQPNSIQVGSNVFTVPPGFYNAINLAAAVTAITGVQTAYQPSQGTFQFASNITALTTEMQNALGLFSGNVSSNVINLSTEEFVFLDIMELRNRTVIDAKTLVGDTYAGSTIATSFAMIPLDVFSGQIKTFKETTDYKMSVSFDTPIPSIQRLTVQWLNKDGRPVNFNGLDVNAFVLRVHCMRSAPEPEPEEPMEEVLMRKIQRAIDDAKPIPKKRPMWLAIAGPLILLIVFAARFLMRTAPPQMPPLVPIVR
jgi:hypothetical protein